MTYAEFIEDKTHLGSQSGFEPVWLPDFLFPFQRALVEWAIRKGRAAVFADCGLGKTPMQLVWAENVVRETGKPVLILTPLAVAGQTCQEGEKFDIEIHRSRDGKAQPNITVTNYERLHLFNPDDFGAVVADESSILKSFEGVTRAQVTEFMRKLPHRSLYTATAAPNDFIELGTSSEALGELGYMDMLNRFFKNDTNTNHPNHGFFSGKWRFRGHAEREFWRWVCSWARAIRKPSDMGFEDGEFRLPPLITQQHIVKAGTLAPGWLFAMPAHGLAEQRDERRRSVRERCERAAEIACKEPGASVLWCNLNDEGDLLENIVPGAVQISGADSDDRKEELFGAFSSGEVRKLVTKSSIAGWGLNWQFCAHQTFFPSHSFEQWYQAIRRSWRFGQKNPVKVDVITSEGESRILSNLQRKAEQSEILFSRLVELMNDELAIQKRTPFIKEERLPAWL